MLLHERAVVERVDRVGAEHDQRLGREVADERGVAPQRVRGALLEARAVVVAEAGLEDQQPAGRAVEVPRAAVGQVVAERDGVELLHHPHVGQAGVQAVAEREVDQPVGAREGHGGLGPLAREELQPPAGPAGEDDDERADAVRGAAHAHHMSPGRSFRSSWSSSRTALARPSSIDMRLSSCSIEMAPP